MTSCAQQHDDRKGLWFSIEIENEEFVAFISAEALSVHFNASDKKSSQQAAYKQNRDIIDAVAQRKFLSGAPRPIKLDASDFRKSGA
jgi:hypothetical protein